jgi:hypothetical protein
VRTVGTYQNYFRDYDPAVGRYVEADPVGLYGSQNLYTYVRDEPTMATDRLGLIDPYKNRPRPPKPYNFPGSSCGPDGDPNNYASSFGSFNFESACQNHDSCYGTCGISKARCDFNFLVDMLSACSGGDGTCVAAAGLYYGGVTAGGAKPFQNARKKCTNCGGASSASGSL